VTRRLGSASSTSSGSSWPRSSRAG
jgi:hypothetical protein